MLGLMYVGAGALYLAFMLLVARGAWKAGRKRGGSLLKCTLFAVIGVLLVYVPVFWNHVPILVAYRSLCANDAGFVVQKSPDEWISDNRDRLRLLQGIDLERTTGSHLMPSGSSRYEFFGGLLAREERAEATRRLGMTFTRGDSRLLDTRTNAVIAHWVNYSVGPREDVRSWLVHSSCFRSDDSPVLHERQYIQQLKEAIK